MWKQRVRNKRMETNFTKLHLIAKLNSAFLTLWQLFSIFRFACYPFFLAHSQSLILHFSKTLKRFCF